MTRKQKKMLIRIIAASVILIACFFIPDENEILRAIAFFVPYAIAGYDIVIKAAKNIRNGQIFDENLLMGIATIGAYGLREYSEAVMVVILYQAGELFQSMAVSRSRKSISELMDIRPDYANLALEDGSYKTVSPEQVCVGDKILIKSGEKIPLDCVITDGESEIDTSSITGESVPRAAKVGDEIVSGCVNISGTLTARVTKTFGESTVSKILELTENNAQRKSKSEKFITRFARVYTPTVVALAVCMAVIPTLIFGNFSAHLKSALIFLVISCPCALVISVPLSFFCGIGCASKNGILIKGANYVESLSGVGRIIFDKTGTLTSGKFEVTDVICQSGFDRDEILTLASMAEFYSDHPIALAVKSAMPFDSSDGISSSRQIIGKGVYADIDGQSVYVGNAALMSDIGVVCMEYDGAKTALHVAADGKYAGTLLISDTVKDGAKEALASLRRRGVKEMIMLTGDRKEVGEDVAEKIGLDSVRSNLLPEDKVRIAEEIMSASDSTTAYVGDGINDAPVLSVADVGIAMGAMGSDAAIEAADIVLMDDSLSKLDTAFAISKKTLRIVKQNIVFAIGVKVLIMLLSAVGFANMWMAIFADVGVSVIAILNALRTFNIKQ